VWRPLNKKIESEQITNIFIFYRILRGILYAYNIE